MISGTASDASGIVAAVEVSVDGGASWHLATGQGNWTYHWTPSTGGPAVIKSRATDDSGNLETPSAGTSVNVTALTCPCSIWDLSATPAVASVVDAQPVELGVKFRSQIGGFITGFRFYKGPTNTGTHTGQLWTSGASLLGTAVLTK